MLFDSIPKCGLYGIPQIDISHFSQATWVWKYYKYSLDPGQVVFCKFTCPDEKSLVPSTTEPFKNINIPFKNRLAAFRYQ